MESNTQLDLLKERISYDINIYGDVDTYDKALKRLLEDSKFIGLSIIYPFDDYEKIELPNKHKNWQLRCCEELFGLIGSKNIKSYAENGVSWIRDSGNLSNDLKEELMPKVGVIK